MHPSIRSAPYLVELEQRLSALDSKSIGGIRSPTRFISERLEKLRFYIDTLPPPEREPYSTHHIPHYQLPERMAGLCNGALSWSHTKEGGEYWASTNRDLRELRFPNPHWRDDERAHLASGEVDLVPWHEEPWYLDTPYPDLHFAIINDSDPGNISYISSEKRGGFGQRTNIKPGRYLAKYFPAMDEKQIKHWIGKLVERENACFHIAETADEIERVYLNGPRSCMSHAERDYHTRGIHPVRAYAGAGLALAYMERRGKITARAVIWPERKIYGRIFGDADRFQNLLQSNGFVSGYFDGAHLTAIRRPRSEHMDFIVPYIDYHKTGYLEDDGKRIRITRDEYLERPGQIYLRRTEGWSRQCPLAGATSKGSPHSSCAYCGEPIQLDDGHYTFPNGNVICLDCCHEECSSCVDCGDLTHNDDIGYYVHDNPVCNSCINANYIWCEGCNDYHTDDTRIWVRAVNGRYVCSDAASDLFCCANCGMAYDNEEEARNTCDYPDCPCKEGAAY